MDIKQVTNNYIKSANVDTKGLRKPRKFDPNAYLAKQNKEREKEIKVAKAFAATNKLNKAKMPKAR